jgi:hypothetical protein
MVKKSRKAVTIRKRGSPPYPLKEKYQQQLDFWRGFLYNCSYPLAQMRRTNKLEHVANNYLRASSTSSPILCWRGVGFASPLISAALSYKQFFKEL